VAALAGVKLPVAEPGLETLVRNGLSASRLRFTTDPAGAVGGAEVVWVAFDTPVNDEDQADVESVLALVRQAFPHLRDGAVVLVSSQLPVGSVRRLESEFADVADGRRVGFAASPENLRLGRAIEVFTHPDRVIVGVRDGKDRGVLERLFAPITTRIEWMSVESAEVTKHAINAFLATSVTFANEVAAICEHVGADAGEVERGLKTELRIGPKAYLSPGGAFAGGTLARDVVFLSALGREHGLETPLLGSVKRSNDYHRHWAERRLADLLGGVAGKTVAVWGLTYKPGTDTLRRSGAVELCEWLHGAGAIPRAHDPAVSRLPEALQDRIRLASSPLDAVDGAAALVVATSWPQYREVDAGDVRARMAGALVLDANRYLAATIGQHAGLTYVSVGKGGS
jgi:UDPglucose 6-dehydrogenase